MTNLPSDRTDFLLKLYESCWTNVSRAEESIWKIFAAYTAILGGTALAKDIIGTFGFVMIVDIFSFIGMAVSLNANSWFARNMGLISNIEKEFFNLKDDAADNTIKSDLDKIIPKSWLENKVPFFNREVWWIMFALFVLVVIIMTAITWNIYQIDEQKTEKENFQIEQQKTTNILLLIFGFIGVSVYGAFLRCNHVDFTRKAEGKKLPEP